MAGQAGLARAVRSYLLRQRLTSVGSTAGAQIEALQARLPIRSSCVGNTRELLLAELLDLPQRAGLTPEEDAVAYLRLTGHSHARGECKCEERGWCSVHYLRTVDIGDEDPAEEILGTKAAQAFGAPPPGRNLVRGLRQVMMSYEDIGAVLGLSRSQVESRWKSASRKLRGAGQEADAEDRAERQHLVQEEDRTQRVREAQQQRWRAYDELRRARRAQRLRQGLEDLAQLAAQRAC